MKHVLVTGGSDSLAHTFANFLLKKGYAVTAVDNFLTSTIDNLADALKNPNFRFLEWDVIQPIPVEQVEFIGKYGLHGLLHFACPASPVDFDQIPFEILGVDSVGTMHTVDLALKYKARYLLASTSEIYGDPLEHPQKETYFGNVNTLGPRACYDEAKRFAEAYVSTAARGIGTLHGKKNYGPLSAGIVRIFNTYGPRMRPDDGRVVPELCVQAIRGNDLSVHGDGKQTRSFCYVSDLVDGIVRLFESDVKVPVNIGNPIERTIIEFAQAVIQIANSGSKLKYLPAREDDPKRRCPDITRAQELLGWQPKVSLEQGLKKVSNSLSQKFK